MMLVSQNRGSNVALVDSSLQGPRRSGPARGAPRELAGTVLRVAADLTGPWRAPCPVAGQAAVPGHCCLVLCPPR